MKTCVAGVTGRLGAELVEGPKWKGSVLCGPAPVRVCLSAAAPARPEWSDVIVLSVPSVPCASVHIPSATSAPDSGGLHLGPVRLVVLSLMSFARTLQEEYLWMYTHDTRGVEKNVDDFVSRSFIPR